MTVGHLDVITQASRFQESLRAAVLLEQVERVRFEKNQTADT